MYKINLSTYSLDALLVFSYAVKHMNFTHAAKELGVTQAAVSRRIHNLEQQLGKLLFVRKPKRKLKLTQDGEKLNQTVIQSLAMIETTISEITKPVDLETISITTTSGFATLWLMPRLAEFNESHPRINVRLVLVDDFLDLKAEGIDIGIRYGTGEWENIDSRLLFSEYVYPVCSPDYLEKHPELDNLETLTKADLLHVEEKILTVANWKKWFREFNVHLDDSHAKLIYNNYPLLIQSCLDGQGVLLGWHHMIYDLINNGKLVKPVSQLINSSNGFYIIHPADKSLNPNAQLFSDWIFENAQQKLP